MIIELMFVGILIFAALFLIKAEHHTKKVKLIAIIIIGLLLYLSIASMFSDEKVDLTSPRGVINAVYVYVGWMGSAVTSLWDIGTETAKTVGNTIKTNATRKDAQPRR